MPARVRPALRAQIRSPHAVNRQVSAMRSPELIIVGQVGEDNGNGPVGA
jgi:hypothetical protein